MKKVLTLIAVVGAISIGSQGSVIYQEDFETLGTGDTLTSPWSWGTVNYTSNMVPTGGQYFPGGAPPGSIYEVETGQAGPGQGVNTLRSYGDYGYAPSFANDQYLETLLFRDHTITAGEAALGEVSFTFDYKAIDLGGASSASIWIKVLDPNAGYSQLDFFSQAISASDTTWQSGSLGLSDITTYEGKLLQIGTSVFSQNYSPTGIGVDNINVQAVPEPATAVLIGLFGGGLLFFRRCFKI